MVRIYWLRNANRQPVACVASEVRQDNEGPTIYFAVSTYNPVDKFDRALGRDIATGRLRKSIDGIPYGINASHRIMEEIVSTDFVTYPQRTREAAELWLETHPWKAIFTLKEETCSTQIAGTTNS